MSKNKTLKTQFVKSHFLDSGAFSLWAKAANYYKENGGGKWDFYNTKEFWDYVDNYAAFIKKYRIAIDLYANVDVIPNPKLTWRNQKYLEEVYGLFPIPVVHYTTNLKWLEKYIEAGYKMIGLGGLVGSTMKEGCRDWLDQCFEMVCNNPERLPEIKLHGFGVTAYKLMIRYPWWSVDSAAWDKVASYGGIYIPHKRKGVFIFDENPYLMKVSLESPERKKRGHFLNLSNKERIIIQEWLDLIQIPLGKINEKGEIEEKGVVTFHVYRRMANLLFFQRMMDSLPKWPWPYHCKRKGMFL